MRRAKSRLKSQAQSRLSKPQNPKLPFIEHLYELRRRLFYVALSVGLWATGAYFVQQYIVAALLKPAAHQQFIYTSVGGGIDFLFRVCIYTGIIFSIPVIVFQILKYLEPLIKKDAIRFMTLGSLASGVLAVAGMAFGYFVGLPAALHFLLHQFTTDQIHPLLTIQSYMSFVTLYMLGAALLFQLPLLLVLINRIKPLKPKKLLGMERWVILIAFVLGGIMNPSPRIQDQVLLAGPMIITYQIGILIIWLGGRGKKRPAHVYSLLEKDEQARAERLARFQAARAALGKRAPAAQMNKVAAQAQAVRQVAVAPAPAPVKSPSQTPVAVAAAPQLPGRASSASSRSSKLPITRRNNYANDFTPRQTNILRPLTPPEDQLAG
ncbi:MAG TPA: twin-arginine translocase subunit TatC [Patescibacteria group bacterium]|nr:twin-arginine translocase subunit TatC [Patescibacteria group bacterium]